MLFLDNLLDVLLELAPWLLLGATIAGLMHGLLPGGFVRRQLGGRGGVLKAVLLGIPLPLCSCGVIPAGLGLKEDGASDGAAVGFLIATPQTGVDSVLVSASFLGWPFALWKVAAALVTGLVGGWITDAGAPPAERSAEEATGGARQGPRAMLAHGLDMVRMIWRWLLFGVVVSALITTLVPADAFANLGTAGVVVAFAAVLGASLPLYVCATASVPIASALVGAGMPTGAALVFLMAGPATNVATLGAVGRAFGRRVLLRYLATIVVGSILFGAAYELFFGPLLVAAGPAHVHRGPVAWVSAVLLGGLLLWFALEDLRAWLAQRRRDVVDGQEQEFQVEGMSCDGCASRLQRVLLATEGVQSAEVSFADGRARVRGPAGRDAVEGAIRGAGFDPLPRSGAA